MAVLTDERRALLMSYCNLTEEQLLPGDDLLLERFYRTAVGYLRGAGVAEPEGDEERQAAYDTVVDAMVMDAWDHRGSQTAGTAMQANQAFRELVSQLKHTEPVFAVDLGWEVQ